MLPALFARKENDKIKLGFRTLLNSNNQHAFDHIVDKFTWMTVKISEFDGRYTIMINNEVIFSKMNNSPSEWQGVNIDISNIYLPAKGEYRNFVYDLCPEIKIGMSEN